MSLHQEFTEVWYCAKTQYDSRECCARREFSLAYADADTSQIEPITLPDGSDCARSGVWESLRVERQIWASRPVDVSLEIEEYSWLWWWSYDSWSIDYLLLWLKCGAEIKILSYDVSKTFEAKQKHKLTAATGAGLDTMWDAVLVIFRTSDTFLAGSGDKLSIKLRKKGGGGDRVELIPEDQFSPGRTYGFLRPRKELSAEFSVNCLETVFLETDGPDALWITDVFVFGLCGKNELVPIAYECGIPRRRQLSQQEGEGTKTLHIPLVKTHDSELSTFGTRLV